MAPATRNARIVLLSVGTVAAMIGLTYASVPLYRLFCQATGYGGTVQRAEAAPKQVLDKTVSVRFDANTSSNNKSSSRSARRSRVGNNIYRTNCINRTTNIH